ncbi:hypothetical protein QQZ08_005206 [Neonectria magnoliae]|uniref:Rhodopsin domain-containing protein n=1 Tax=Neonectria magnoliae TaxID=2732573 RepID=A0ABR1I508_9HYPO
MSQEVGAMPPPEGVTPDFDGSSPLQRIVVIVNACTFALATVTLALRLYCASVIVRRLDWDIPLIILSWAGSLAFFIAIILAIPSGFGKHLWDVRASDVEGYLNLLLVLGLTYVWPPTFTKLAILVLYHRIIPNFGFRLTIYAVAASLVVYTLVTTILLAGPCEPLKPGTGTCIVNLTISQAVFNIVSDIIIIVLPIPTIHRLNMRLKQKITIGLLLALGSAVVVVSCIRFGYVQKMEKNPDITWTQALASLWSCIEMNTGIICNCLAQMKPFVRKHIAWLAKFVSRTSEQKSYPDAAQNDHSYKRWRGDNASHEYQLHSIGRAQQPTHDNPGHDIVVVDEFIVQYTTSRNTGDASSTEDILAHRP